MMPAENPRLTDRNFLLAVLEKSATSPPIPVARPAKRVRRKAIATFSTNTTFRVLPAYCCLKATAECLLWLTFYSIFLRLQEVRTWKSENLQVGPATSGCAGRAGRQEGVHSAKASSYLMFFARIGRFRQKKCCSLIDYMLLFR